MDQTQAAIGYSIIANLGDDRQITVQHFVGDDQDDATVNAVIDRIMRVVDRQKAIRKIPDLQAERRQIEGQLAQAERDLAMVEADHQAKVEARNARVIDLQARDKTLNDEGYQEHTASGRRGPYKPVGQRAGAINAIKAELQKIVEDAVAQENERAVALQNLEANNQMRRARIAQLDAEIVECQAQV